VVRLATVAGRSGGSPTRGMVHGTAAPSASMSASGDHIRTHIFAEAMLLCLIGAVLGVLATSVNADSHNWAVAVPSVAWAGGLGGALGVGAIAGLLPASRAAHLPATKAVRTL
jgi:putative ABC transport system permease protein